MKKLTLITYLVLFFSIISINAQTAAFPGAEGHGRNTTGGRGGMVYYVTNLTDVNSGNSTTREGSLRWCLSQNGTKTILFKVSGTIILKSNLSISKGNVSILGQSAPGDGVCVGGFPVSISANNVIIRYLRFRMGQEYISSADGADVLGSRGYSNFIVDHCSMSWSTDECVSIYGNENTTLQWCIITESLRLAKHSKGPHGYGGIWGGKRASFHHNLLANNDSRTPRFGPATSTQGTDTTDMRNCVIYNWGGIGCYGAEAMKVNIVNNYYKAGPATSSGNAKARICAIDKKINLSTTDDFYPINNVWGKFYIDGNYVDASTSTSSSDKTLCNNATADNWTYGVFNQISSSYGITLAEKTALKSTTAFPTGTVTTHTAQKAYEKVLAFAGCSLQRDAHDTRIVNETSTGTATFKGLSKYNGLGSVTYPAGTVIGTETLTTATTINWKSTSYPKSGIIDSETDIKPADAPTDWSPWPTLNSTTAPTDTNIDGIPDGWLEANYPGKTAVDKNEEGYTYLEIYLNDIVKNITVQQLTDGITSGIESPDLPKTKSTSYLNQDKSILITNAENIINEISIFNLSGIKLFTQKNASTYSEIAFSRFDKGVYLVLVYCEGYNLPNVTKIIKS